MSPPTKPEQVRERVHFRLIVTPCCGQALCWVNPRLPNYCPECSKPIYRELKFDGSQIVMNDEEAWLLTKDSIRTRPTTL